VKQEKEEAPRLLGALIYGDGIQEVQEEGCHRRRSRSGAARAAERALPLKIKKTAPVAGRSQHGGLDYHAVIAPVYDSGQEIPNENGSRPVLDVHHDTVPEHFVRHAAAAAIEKKHHISRPVALARAAIHDGVGVRLRELLLLGDPYHLGGKFSVRSLDVAGG